MGVSIGVLFQVTSALLIKSLDHPTLMFAVFHMVEQSQGVRTEFFGNKTKLYNVL